MAKKKRGSFKNKVSKNSEKQRSGARSYGYLNIPKGVEIFKAEPGSRVEFDILPYEVTSAVHPDRDDELDIAVPGELWYKRPFKIHRNVGPENETVVCLTSFGKKCPLCEYRAKRMKEGAEKEETDELRASSRNLYALKPRKSKKYEDTIHIWDFPQFLFQNLLNEELNEDEDYANFPSLEDGFTLKVRFDEEVFMKNKFAQAGRIDFIERDYVYEEDILEEVPNLDEVLVELSAEKIEQLFFGLGEDDLEDPEEEQGTPKRKKKTVSKKKKEVEEEPEEEDDVPEEDPEEDEPEEKPKNKKKTVSKKKEDPEEDPEEDDPEEKPKMKRKGTKKETEEEECPYGHVFGSDCDKHKECNTCEKWDDCIEAQ